MTRFERKLNADKRYGRNRIRELGRYLQSVRERDLAGGYAALTENRYVENARLGGGSPSASTVLNGDYTWVNYAAVLVGASTQIEVDLGSTLVWCGKFTITNPRIEATSRLQVWQDPGPYTGKGTRADEAEMQPVTVIAVEPGAGSAVVKWQTPPLLSGVPVGRNNFRAGSGSNSDYRETAIRLNKVRGNVKFSYLIF